jgi:undecaprenyl pyrophosphate phosphatase UppP
VVVYFLYFEEFVEVVFVVFCVDWLWIVVLFVVAVVVVAKFIDFLKTKPMTNFAIYRIIVGLLVLFLGLVNII